jgi:hypothetical protein
MAAETKHVKGLVPEINKKKKKFKLKYILFMQCLKTCKSLLVSDILTTVVFSSSESAFSSPLLSPISVKLNEFLI